MSTFPARADPAQPQGASPHELPSWSSSATAGTASTTSTRFRCASSTSAGYSRRLTPARPACSRSTGPPIQENPSCPARRSDPHRPPGLRAPHPGQRRADVRGDDPAVTGLVPGYLRRGPVRRVVLEPCVGHLHGEGHGLRPAVRWATRGRVMPGTILDFDYWLRGSRRGRGQRDQGRHRPHDGRRSRRHRPVRRPHQLRPPRSRSSPPAKASSGAREAAAG